MNMNEGTIERAVQIITGLTLITMVILGTLGVWGWIQSACEAESVWFNC